MNAHPPEAECRLVILLHGGPGAPGGLDGLAAGLGRLFRVMAPSQRRSGGAPLTVGIHIDDVRTLIESLGGPPGRPALVGHSWGAMLALAVAAAHPMLVGPIALIGCGTFTARARAVFQAAVDCRIDSAVRRRLEQLEEDSADIDASFAAMGELLAPAFSFDLVEPPRTGRCDRRGHDETWADMLRLQAEGVYPAAFRVIDSPVLMLHGRDDPHPGGLIRDDLRHVMPHLESNEFEQCGHYPWLERAARESFFEALCRWLERHAR